MTAPGGSRADGPLIRGLAEPTHEWPSGVGAPSIVHIAQGRTPERAERDVTVTRIVAWAIVLSVLAAGVWQIVEWVAGAMS